MVSTDTPRGRKSKGGAVILQVDCYKGMSLPLFAKRLSHHLVKDIVMNVERMEWEYACDV